MPPLSQQVADLLATASQIDAVKELSRRGLAIDDPGAWVRQLRQVEKALVDQMVEQVSAITKPI